MRRGFAFVVVALTLVVATGVARADILSRILGVAERTAGKAAVRGATTLEHAAEHVRLRAPTSKAPLLAATATDEGHWTFVNAAGERFTAGTPAELTKVAAMLAPGATDAPRLVITRETLFRDPAVFKDLPKGMTVDVLLGDATHAVELTRTAPLVAIRPNLLVSALDRDAFDAAVWMLDRPLSRADVRLIALEPGGATTLPSVPRRDPTTGNAVTDRLDPRALASLGSVRGQTLMVTGRIDQDRLLYRAPSGADVPVLLADLRKAASDADANLVVLSSSGTRQPGARNWLWQQVSVSGLDTALAHPTMGDAIASLAGEPPMIVTSAPSASGRMRLVFVRRETPSALPAMPWTDVLDGTLAEITGHLTIKSLEADVLTRERQNEIDSRLVPWMHSLVQYGYLAALLLGVIGIPYARVWFRKLWPPERRDDFKGVAGLALAKAVRGAAFVFVFVPLVAFASAPLSLLRSAWDQLTGLALIVSWPFRALARGLAPKG